MLRLKKKYTQNTIKERKEKNGLVLFVHFHTTKILGWATFCCRALSSALCYFANVSGLNIIVASSSSSPSFDNQIFLLKIKKS